MSVTARYLQAVATGKVLFDAAQEDAAKRLQRLAEDLAAFRPGLFRRQAPPRGLYIWGDVGRGKSMLMDMFFAEIGEESKRRLHFNAFMAEAHGVLHALRRDASLRDPLPVAAKKLERRLICFDEFQVEDVADAMILGRLFEQLFARGTVVVATSNTPPDKLYLKGLNRQLFLPFIAVLKEQMEVFHLKGVDHRRDFDGTRYGTGDEGAAALERRWRVLGGDGEHMRTLQVLGRALSVPRAVGKAARFTFAELCEAPLGPADYLALAGEFDTLLVETIPVLTPAMRDSARRFTTLIDALYDGRVALYAAAEAEPDELFPERGAEFERTVSRLLEMRSDAYISKACSGT